MNPKLRLEILERDDYTCQICFAKDKELEVHHVIPRRFLGMDTSSNLTSVCHYCHKIIEFTRSISEKSKELKNKINSKYLTKLSKFGTSHILILKKDLIYDSAFPFKILDQLVVEMQGGKLVIGKVEHLIT